jgi:hypothetical protein
MTFIQTCFMVITVACMGACTPTLDWREFVPEGTELKASFPCKPNRHLRTVVLASSKQPMTLLSCTAGGATYALSFINVPQPEQVSSALTELRESSKRNIQGKELRVALAHVKGMTPNDAAVHVVMSGLLPDGVAVQSHTLLFVHGLRVYQATVIASQLAQQPCLTSVDTFLSGLRFAV